MQHMVKTFELAGPFHGKDIEGLFDDAQKGSIPLRVRTQGAGISIGEVLAD